MVNQAPPTSRQPALSQRLWELATIFLKLGIIGFGGPQAHIAMQNDEVVVRREWLTPDEFTQGLAVCEMLPGPASTQMGIYIGYIRAGQVGALVSGLCFIAPAFLIVLALSWGYFQFQGTPQVNGLFLGISPVVAAIILAFCWKLGKKALKDWQRGVIAIAVFLITTASSLNVLIQFIAAGLIGLWLYRPHQADRSPPSQLNGWFWPSLPLLLANAPAETLTLSGFWGLERMGDFSLPLLLFFLKVGSFIFGGGLVIIPLLEFEVVDKLDWLTRTEFINGVAIGQLSPGPVVLAAAFVGYKVAGVFGALIASIGIFTPSFGFIMLAAPLLLQIRQSPWVRAFLQGVTPAVLGAIAAAAAPLLQTALVQANLFLSVAAGLIGLAALVAILRYRLPTWKLVPLGGFLGLLVSLAPVT